MCALEKKGSQLRQGPRTLYFNAKVPENEFPGAFCPVAKTLSGCHSGAKEQAFRTVQSGVAPGRWAGRCPSTSPDVLPPGARGSLALQGPRSRCRRLRRVGTRTVPGNLQGDARGPKKPQNGECVRPGCEDGDEMLVGPGVSGPGLPKVKSRVLGAASRTSAGSRTRRGGWASSRTPGVLPGLCARRFRGDPAA